MTLAQRSVFRAYRVMSNWPAPTYDRRIEVPGFGQIDILPQIVLESTRVEQIQPQVVTMVNDPRDRTRLENLLYSGWSRDQPAICYGIHSQPSATQNTPGADGNTERSAQILVNFQVDPMRWLIVFDEPVAQLVGGNGADNNGVGGTGAVGTGYAAAEVWLETAIQVRFADTHAPARFESIFVFPEPSYGTPEKVIRRPDVWQNYIGRYDPDTHEFLGTDEDIPDAQDRADYYLNGESLQWLDTGALTTVYNGLVPVWLDGAISQVTWEVGGGGVKTTASRNSEHSPYVPDLYARLRANHLAPAQLEKREAEGNELKTGQLNPTRQARTGFDGATLKARGGG